MTRFIPPEPIGVHAKKFRHQYPAEVHSLINGDLVTGEAGSWSLIYPATEETIATVSGCNGAQVARAANIAHQTFEAGDWSAKPLEERQAIFRKIADAIDAHADELAFLQTCETGIPYAQFRSMHIARSANNFRFFSDAAATVSGDTYTQTGRYLSVSLQEPIGVGAIIAPWNAPLALASMKVAACMITGNSCLLKPSEQTPFSVLRMVQIMHECGVPKGAIHLINGTGQDAGAAMVADPKIGAVNFVGGTSTGQQIMKAAADGLKKLSLELGGKSANIVTSSADMDAAIDGSLLGSFAGNGEQCLTGSRLLIQNDIADEFIARFCERTANLTVGDPFHPDVEIGPLAFASHYKHVRSFVDTARSEGDTILIGGDDPAPDTEGYYFTPMAVSVQDNSTSVCQIEVFGPVVSILRFDTLDEAISIANDSDFGLVSYIWTSDIQSMMTMTRKIQAGTVWVNTPMTRDLRAPFGGYKLSGLGRDGLSGSMELFTEQKTLMIPQDALHLPKLGQKK